MALFQRKPPAPAASELRRERRALLMLREERLRDLGGLTLEMYRRDQFNETLVVERCAELVAIETRVSRDRRARQGRRAAAQAEDAVRLRRADADRCPVLPELRAVARRDRRRRRGHAGVSADRGGARARAAEPPSTRAQEFCLRVVSGFRAQNDSAGCRPTSDRSGCASAGSDSSRAPAQQRRSGWPGKAPRPSGCVPRRAGASPRRRRRVEPASQLAVWPRAQRGWTIVLVSIPKADGRDEAVAVAQQARTRGLSRVGVLDSSRFASLQPGYWMTLSGRFQSEADATGRCDGRGLPSRAPRVVQIEP